MRSDTWPHQPAAANAQIPLANGEPSIHGRLLTSLGRYSFPKADVEHTNSHDRNLSSPSCANTLEPTWFDPRLDALGRTRAEPPSNYPVPSHTFSWVSVKSATASTKSGCANTEVVLKHIVVNTTLKNLKQSFVFIIIIFSCCVLF